jgi:signal peptidase I
MTEYDETLPNGVVHSIIEASDDAPLDNTELFTVPEKHFFFMGDNRDNSADSRAHIGAVSRDNVLGRVWFVWYSHNYYAPMLSIWSWGNKMRWDRFGMGIN